MSSKLTISENGPIKLEGEFTLHDQAGNELDFGGKSTLWLCRCGATKKAPLCDGSHSACGFVAPAKAD